MSFLRDLKSDLDTSSKQPSFLNAVSSSPKLDVQKRFEEHIFRRLGWNDSLKPPKNIQEAVSNLKAVAGVVQSIVSAIDKLKSESKPNLSLRNDPDEIISKTQEQFQGFFTKDLEKTIGVKVPKTMKQQIQLQDPAKNIKEDLNPTNLFSSGLIQDILDLYRDLTGADGGADDYKNIKEKTLALFREIWEVNKIIELIVQQYPPAIDASRRIALENNKLYIRQLTNHFLSLSRIYIDGQNSSATTDKALYEQAVEVKDILLKISDAYKQAKVQEGSDLNALDGVMVDVARARTAIASLITKNKKYLNSVNASWNSIRPKVIKKTEVGEVLYDVNELFFVEDDKFEIIYSRFYQHARPSYKISGVSSVNKDATDFIDTTKTRKDIIAGADESVPTNLEIAPKAPGLAEATADEPSTETKETKDLLGPLDESLVKKLRQDCFPNPYGKKDDNGAIGKYHFTAKKLYELGYVKPGVTTAALKQKKNWTGKDGISSREAFLGNSEVQDKAFSLFSRIIYKKILGANLIKKNAKTNEVAAAVATAYRFGSGALKTIEASSTTKSTKGGDASKFYQKVLGNFPDEVPKNEVTDSIKSLGGSDADALEANASANTIPESQSLYFPPTPTVTAYPYNTVTESESGHFREVNDTPGSESIQERHRTGSGTEILPDGSTKRLVVGDGYRAVLGNDNIMVSGSLNIVAVGDVTIKASGDLDLAAGNDINIRAGNNFVVDCGGLHKTDVDGNMFTSVEGNRIDLSEGDHSIQSDNNLSLDANMTTITARDGGCHIRSSDDITAHAKSVSILGKQQVAIASDEVAAIAAEQVSVQADKHAWINAKEVLSLIGKNSVIYARENLGIKGEDGIAVNGGNSLRMGGQSVYIAGQSMALRASGLVSASVTRAGGLFATPNPGTPPPVSLLGAAGQTGESERAEVKKSDFVESIRFAPSIFGNFGHGSGND